MSYKQICLMNGCFITACTMELDSREVDRLLTGLVDPNCLSRQGTTPLVEAAKFGYVVIAENLLDSGADPNKANEHGSTPIYWAARRGHRATVELLLQGPNSTEEIGSSFLT